MEKSPSLPEFALSSRMLTLPQARAFCGFNNRWSFRKWVNKNNIRIYPIGKGRVRYDELIWCIDNLKESQWKKPKKSLPSTAPKPSSYSEVIHPVA